MTSFRGKHFNKRTNIWIFERLYSSSDALPKRRGEKRKAREKRRGPGSAGWGPSMRPTGGLMTRRGTIQPHAARACCAVVGSSKKRKRKEKGKGERRARPAVRRSAPPGDISHSSRHAITGSKPPPPRDAASPSSTPHFSAFLLLEGGGRRCLFRRALKLAHRYSARWSLPLLACGFSFLLFPLLARRGGLLVVSFAVSRCWRCGLSPCSSYFVSEADLVRNRSGFKNLSPLLINWINRTRLTPRLIPPNSFSLHQLRTKIRRTVPLSNRQPDRNFSRKSSDHFHASIRATSNPWLAAINPWTRLFCHSSVSR